MRGPACDGEVDLVAGFPMVEEEDEAEGERILGYSLIPTDIV